MIIDTCYDYTVIYYIGNTAMWSNVHTVAAATNMQTILL